MPRNDAADRYSPPIAAAFHVGLTTREATRKSEVVRASLRPYAPMATVTRVTATIAGTVYGLAVICPDAAPARRSPARCARPGARTPSRRSPGTGRQPPRGAARAD